jgi:hypothetical protein
LEVIFGFFVAGIAGAFGELSKALMKKYDCNYNYQSCFFEKLSKAPQKLEIPNPITSYRSPKGVCFK